MTDKQPNALRLAQQLEAGDIHECAAQAADELRLLHASIEALEQENLRRYERMAALEKALKYEQHREGRIGTHGPSCHTWGPAHYECAARRIAELEAALETAVEALDEFMYANTDKAQALGMRALLAARQALRNDK